MSACPAAIAQTVGVSPATVSRILKRAGLSRLKDLAPPEPVRRYERQHPGELIHLDIKKLGRFHQIGHRITGDRRGRATPRARRGGRLEFVHVCVDDASRIAFTRILPDETARSAILFLRATLAYYRSLGITVTRVMSDNGSCYKAHAFARTCRQLKPSTSGPSPTRPRPTARPERFIQTALREWAYARAYPTSDHRAAELPPWMHRYNWHRPHGSLNGQTPSAASVSPRTTC